MKWMAISAVLTCTIAAGQTTQPTSRPTTAPARMTQKQARQYVDNLPENIRQALKDGEWARRDAILLALSKTERDSLVSRKEFYPPKLALRNGSIGELKYKHLEVNEIIDEQNLVVRSIKDYGRDRDYFWLRGLDTKVLADDQVISNMVPGFWIVSGTQRRGSRTLFVVERYQFPPVWTADVGKAIAKMVDEEWKEWINRGKL